MWRCGKTPEKGWDVDEDGQKEQNVWKELTGETEPQSGGGGSAQAIVMMMMLPHVLKASVWPNIGVVYTLCSHSGAL